MEGKIVLVPLTRKEFRTAKNGRIVEKHCVIEGDDCCILLSDRLISHEEFVYLLDSGINVFTINVADINWHDLDRWAKYNMVAEYNNGVSLCIISQNMYHQLQKEREEDERDNTRRLPRSPEDNGF